MSNLNGQRGVFGNYFFEAMSKKLKEMQEEIKAKYKVKIDNLYNSLESLENAISNYILWLNTPNIPNNDIIIGQKGFNEELRKSIKKFFDSLIDISYGNNLKVIDSKNKLDELFKEIISFDFSPDENDVVNFSSNSNQINDYSQFDNQNINNSRKDLLIILIKKKKKEKIKKPTNIILLKNL